MEAHCNLKRKSIHERNNDKISDNLENAFKDTKHNSQKMENLQYIRNSDESSSDNENEDISNNFQYKSLGNDTCKIDSEIQRRSRKSKLIRESNSPQVSSTKKNLQSQTTKIEKYSVISEQQNNCIILLRIFLILIIIIGIICIVTFNFEKLQQTLKNGNQPEFVLHDVKETLKNLKSKYRNQDSSLWKGVYSRISALIRKPEKPSIILLVGDEENALDCLSILLGNVSSNALNSHRLTLTPDEFESDAGSVIENMRFRMQNNKAIIIQDLLNINTEALKAFHNLCDTINPLVKDVIYIITIIANNVSKENPLDFVEKELKKKLSGKIKEDAIQPLITRITDGLISKIEPEPNLTDCPLPKKSKRG